MAASRRAILSRTLGSANTTGGGVAASGSANDMECTALMMAQDSAAIQILLEAMHLYIMDIDSLSRDEATVNPPPGEKTACFVPTKGMVTESITNICMFIHRIPPSCCELLYIICWVSSYWCSLIHVEMFIAQPLLAKLVHFQGYPHTLIPLTVAHVPSMHVSLLSPLPPLFLRQHVSARILDSFKDMFGFYN